MKRAMAFLSIGLFALSVSASASDPWRLTASIIRKATGTNQFASLQKEYPQFLQKYDANSVASATLEVATMQFAGKTICQPNDARLTQQLETLHLCLKNGNCLGTYSTYPSWDDPCGCRANLPPVESDPWGLASDIVKKATGANEFAELQTEYPQFLKKYDANTVDSATLEVTTVQYAGKTVCQAGDARLTQQLETLHLCLKNGDCSGTYSTAPSWADPCACQRN